METALYEILALVTSIVGKANPALYDNTTEFGTWQEQVIDNAKIVVTTWNNEATDADEALDRMEKLFIRALHY